MSYVVTDIDKFLKGKKYGFYQLITDPNKGGLGAKDPKVIRLKKLWQAAEDAKGTNTKLDAYKELQDELNEVWFTQARKDRLNQLNEHLAQNNATPEQLDPTNKEEYDVLNKLMEYSDMPAANELENLQLGEAFSEHYSPKQMAKLAADYGYDYRNKEERAEFVKKVGEYIRQQDVEKIWNDDIYASLVTPIAKEYAKNNYQNIEGLGDLAPALAADVGVNTLMAGAPGFAAEKVGGKVLGNKAVQTLANNVAAPVAREVANYKLNGESAEDAVKNAAAGIVTNYVTPYVVNKAGSKLYRFVGNEEKFAAADVINKKANEARAIYDKMKSGAVWAEKGPNDELSFYRLNTRTMRPERVQSSQSARGKGYISPDEVKTFWDNIDLLRNNPVKRKIDKETKREISQQVDELGLTGKAAKQEKKNMWDFNRQMQADEVLAKMEGDSDKYMKNLDEGKKEAERFAGMSPYEVADAANIAPKETFFNWAPQTDLYKAGSSYVGNQQGRTKYMGMALDPLAKQIPGMEKIDLTVKEKPNKEKDPELQMVERLYKLHKKYPKLVDKPELPEKWKKDYKIEDIFGD